MRAGAGARILGAMMRRSILAAVVAAFAAAPALAGPAPPVAVELFTSQGCYSCPPAEKYLTELADRPDVVALEWHVDYWDDLVYGSAGQWKDPFSSPEATARQYDYNAAIEGRRRAYTPQMVVAGQKGMVGSDRGRVESAVRRLRKAGTGASIAVTPGPDGRLLVSAAGATGRVWRVDFIREHVTEVLRGENKGKRLISRHIVKARTAIGDAADGQIAIAPPKPGEGCAILLQNGDTAPILAAAYCAPPGRS